MLMTALPPTFLARCCSVITALRNAHSQACASALAKAFVFLLVDHWPISLATFGCRCPPKYNLTPGSSLACAAGDFNACPIGYRF